MKTFSPIIVTSTKNHQHEFTPNMISDGIIFFNCILRLINFFLPN